MNTRATPLPRLHATNLRARVLVDWTRRG
jgi:hypothetical protein